MEDYMKLLNTLFFICLSQTALAATSEQVVVTVTPTSPTVITADLELSTRRVVAPWFAQHITIKNNSDKPVTIIALRYDSKLPNRQDSSMRTYLMANLYNFTMTCSGGSTLNVNFTDFGTFAPGTEGALNLTFRGDPGACAVPAAITPPLYVGGIGFRRTKPLFIMSS
jgi:hypothetical protein